MTGRNIAGEVSPWTRIHKAASPGGAAWHAKSRSQLYAAPAGACVSIRFHRWLTPPAKLFRPSGTGRNQIECRGVDRRQLLPHHKVRHDGAERRERAQGEGILPQLTNRFAARVSEPKFHDFPPWNAATP